MDRQLVERHLRLALDHVERGEQSVARQKEIVRALERDGHDAKHAREMLATFEEIQKLHLADRDRLRRELEQA
jgi:hypothetical protein